MAVLVDHLSKTRHSASHQLSRSRDGRNRVSEEAPSPEIQPSLARPVVGDTPFPTVQAASSGAGQHAVIGAVFQSAACSHGDADQGLFGDGDGQAGRVG